MFRVGLIGCGGISGVHKHVIDDTPNAELRCVCDIVPERMERFSGPGIERMTNWREMIRREDIDAVHICTPHYLHAEMAIEAMEQGKHVVCEKPMAIHAVDARRMAETARRTGKRLTICFQNRYNAVSLRLKELLESGEAGALLSGRAVMTWNRDAAYYATGEWRGKWETEGGALMINQAIHTVDLLRWLCGDFAEVKSTLSAKRLGEVIECEDTADILLTRADGARFLIYASNCSAASVPVEVWLECEKLRLIMIGDKLLVEDRASGEARLETLTPESRCVGKQVWGAGHGQLIPDFYERVSRGAEPWITPEDALKTAELMEQIYGKREIIK
ncbi:MAG: Gfo/Idh/MocA family oxidoreductase [Clostridia bacterium]|nr:Gfo/Idh/MocA family oxidoreductase [Clostridia bacterium]